MNLSLEQGKKLVKLARDSINAYFSNKEIKAEEFTEKRGVFVTIHSYPINQLRGCIGFPEPFLPLGEAVIKSARAAAFSDPRFFPLEKEELNSVIFEVSVLTKPELIKVKKPEECLKKIKIGRDGLIAESENFKGLLLTIVAVDQKWGVEEFLNQTCIKAGLAPETWKKPDCKIYSFQTQVFREKAPNGEIEEVKLVS